MLNIHQFLYQQRLWKVSTFVILAHLLLTQIGYTQTLSSNHQDSILEGSIHVQPAQILPGHQTNRIQPGTPIKISLTIENKGQQTNFPGQLYVRYAFSHPLDKEATSTIFETEKKPLPSIEPGEKIEILFDTPHYIPSLLDFVRYDWSMREYQAIAIVKQEEHMIGTLALTFSAYYYPGIKSERLQKIPGYTKDTLHSLK